MLVFSANIAHSLSLKTGQLYQALHFSSLFSMESVTGRDFLSYLGTEPKIAFLPGFWSGSMVFAMKKKKKKKKRKCNV